MNHTVAQSSGPAEARFIVPDRCKPGEQIASIRLITSDSHVRAVSARDVERGLQILLGPVTWGGAHDDLLEVVSRELGRSRQERPVSENNFAQVVEALGELGEAVVEQRNMPSRPNQASVRMSAIRVAVQALRVAIDGDSVYHTLPENLHAQVR